MGVLTYKGATAEESLASENVELVDEWVEVQGLDEQGRAGALLFAQSGCQNCHIYLEAGSQNLGAPDLSEEGQKGRGIQWQIDHLICPSCVTPGSPMPAFENYTDEQYQQLAQFREQSQGAGAGG